MAGGGTHTGGTGFPHSSSSKGTAHHLYTSFLYSQAILWACAIRARAHRPHPPAHKSWSEVERTTPTQVNQQVKKIVSGGMSRHRPYRAGCTMPGPLQLRANLPLVLVGQSHILSHPLLRLACQPVLQLQILHPPSKTPALPPLQAVKGWGKEVQVWLAAAAGARAAATPSMPSQQARQHMRSVGMPAAPHAHHHHTAVQKR